ncbi:MAG: tRNA (N6-isopentenyl adenosine(37)-C2)-methylthiotransferase MiaB [Candidatus Caenarcaniphilales bacterium]|jgi:tRNA-2-methylthio-N6-dimethylallyladenosine synthase|nr:tRNA (N6-isopentenyl adenosine(37)-C2)-methylthiotransferase MiaB [Candidatus Caenarcaniphilales bacterium]
MPARSKKKVFIETLGCQMNMADTERMLGLLEEIEYYPTENVAEADLSILNSCSIREHAVDKMKSYIGSWDRIRKAGSLIAIAGCVAQQEGKKLLHQVRTADILIGTHNIHRLPDLVIEAEGKLTEAINNNIPEAIENKGTYQRATTAEIWEELPEDIPETPIFRKTKYFAWVNVIYGCNYRCTYCIVPKTRGDQRSRSIKEIVDEVSVLADEGYEEIILLGQNVDGYGLDIGSNLATLLREVHKVDGIKRIKFLTSHPCDMTFELIETVAELDKVSKYFHIPIQAGNNEVLKRMARRYTVERYMELINYIRKLMPDASITGDVIVGFPGETHEQFMDTVRAIQIIGYDACNTAVYSPRPYTPAADWEDPVSATEKQERIRFLNAIVTEVADKQAQRYLNTIQDILIEGPSQRNPDRLTGRISHNKTTNIECDPKLHDKYIGKFTKVKITQAKAWALRGEIVN